MTSLGISERCSICLRIQPDAHAVLTDAEDVHVRHAFHPRKFVAQLQGGEIAQEKSIVIGMRRSECDDLQDGGGFLLRYDALLLDCLGQLRERGGNAILHEHLRKIEIGSDFEGDCQRIATIGSAGGLHVKHVLDTVDLLLDRKRDCLDQRLCIRAGIIGRYLNVGGVIGGYCATGRL